MSKKLKIATVFSGIGAPEYALSELGIDYKIVFACDNGERNIKKPVKKIKELLKGKTEEQQKEILCDLYSKTGKENEVKKTYFANYDIDEKQWYEDIRFLNAKKYKNKIDLLVGGSPCQSFSVNGKRAGLKDVRGTLFYDYARIITECKPKVFIYENVRGMLNHNKGKTWEVVKDVFQSIGYKIYIKKDSNGKEDPVLNSKRFGIPQNRERIFIVGFKKDILKTEFNFPKEKNIDSQVSDFLDKNVDIKYFLNKKGFEFVTTSPSRAQVNEKIMRCQKANQQFNWNGDFVFIPAYRLRTPIKNKCYLSQWNGTIGAIRKLTPRECLRLMGFRDDFKIVVDDINMYRQSGNSIVVNVLKAIYKEIFKTGVWK